MSVNIQKITDHNRIVIGGIPLVVPLSVFPAKAGLGNSIPQSRDFRRGDGQRGFLWLQKDRQDIFDVALISA
jgi:hypothetical protein